MRRQALTAFFIDILCQTLLPIDNHRRRTQIIFLEETHKHSHAKLALIIVIEQS
jgi:hypothetical protein